jgi:hypothetical protein
MKVDMSVPFDRSFNRNFDLSERTILQATMSETASIFENIPYSWDNADQGTGFGDIGGDIWSCWSFLNVTIPQDVTITKATMVWKPSTDPDTISADLLFDCEKDATPVDVTNTTPLNRPYQDSFVWTTANDTITGLTLTGDEEYTYNIVIDPAIFQECIDLGGWNRKFNLRGRAPDTPSNTWVGQRDIASLIVEYYEN